MALQSKLLVGLSVLVSVNALGADFGVLERDYQFRCAKDCQGVLPARAAADSEVALLIRGDDDLAARIQSLQSARRSIRIQALDFSGDETGLLVSEILKQKKKAGLDVRVIVDAVTNLHSDNDRYPSQTQWMYYDLRRNGIPVEGYEPVYGQIGNELPIKDPMLINKRYHDKMWVIDAELASGIAIVGGRNVANEYFAVGPDAAHKWRDQDVIVRGKLVRDIRDVFDRNFHYFKELPASNGKTAEVEDLWGAWLKRASKDETTPVNYKTYAEPTRIVQEMAKRELHHDWQPVRARFIQNRPRSGESYIKQAYLDLIGSAQKELLIANAYFLPNKDISDALLNAARRGVRVTILTNSLQTNDLPALSFAARYQYEELISVNHEDAVGDNRGWLRIWEWRGDLFGQSTIHAKFAVADRLHAIVGSYNLDPRSELLNSETVLAFENEQLASDLAAHYWDSDIAQSEMITLDQAHEFHHPKSLNDQVKLNNALIIRDWL
ncbi:MAG: phospholipase D-like domain-containing protein [Bdellovibrionota bacterium]